MFREVKIPDVDGRLLLHSMPGRYEEFGDCLDEMGREQVSAIVALTPREEIAERSIRYAHAITAGESRLPEVIHLPVKDFSAPAKEEQSRFFAIADDVVRRLSDGQTVLVHCGAGHGRTGMFAAIVLLRLGYSHDEALSRVGEAGSAPETAEQRRVVRVAADGNRDT